MDTFNNSLTAENLTFTGNQNITRWLEIPSSVSYLTEGRFNLTGYSSGRSPEIYYFMNETTGDAEDGRGNYNATVSGVTRGQAGIINNSYSFDGVNDYVDISDIGFNLSSTNWSFNFWLKFTGTGTQQLVSSNDNEWLTYKYSTSIGGNWWNETGNSHSIGHSDSSLSDGTWHMVTYVFNGTGIALFINGTYADSTKFYGAKGVADLGYDKMIGRKNTGVEYFNGNMDEFGFWKEALTQAEISELFNEGNGFVPSMLEGGSTNNTWMYLGDTRVNLSVASNGTIPTTVRVDNLNDYISAYLNSSYLVGDNYTIPFIFHSDNAGVLEYSNMLFSNEEFAENSQTYNAQTIEGSSETFKINITYDSLAYTTVTPTFIYNGTSYIGTTADTGNTRVYSKTINVPAVTVDANMSFYWNFGMNDGSTTTYFTSTSHNQSVQNILIDNCTTYTTLIYNFTARDEALRNILNGTGANVTTEVNLILSSLGTENGVIDYSHTYTFTNPSQICLSLPLNQTTYRVDLTVGYEAEDYVKKFYYIDNGTISNDTIPQNIDLHDLPLDDSTSFLFKFVDTNGLAPEGAIVHVDRKYIGEGIFREVERAKTDNSGETHIHLVQEDVIYRFRITKDGTLLYTSTEYQAKCLSTPCSITIRATGEYFDTDEDLWDNMAGGTYSISANRTARTVTLLFASNSDPVEYLNMNLTIYQTRDNSVKQSVASGSLNSTYGSITVTVPVTYGNQTYVYEIRKDGDLVIWGWVTLLQKGTDFFGNTLGVILTAFMVLTIGLMAVSEGVPVIVFIILGLGISMALSMIELTWVAFICLVLAGGILIYKLTKRRNG